MCEVLQELRSRLHFDAHPEPNGKLHVREQNCNTVRPHQALHYLTPQEIVAQRKNRARQPIVTNLPDEYNSLCVQLETKRIIAESVDATRCAREAVSER